MSQDGSQDRSTRRAFRQRGSDRRTRRMLSPPPYYTANGTVFIDRRSHLERRSCWVRDFFLGDDDEGKH